MTARNEPWSLKKPNLLIVEGYSDLRFIAEFLEHLGNSKTTDIYRVEGRPDFEPRIPALLQPSTLAIAKHIGVVIDADSSAEGSFHKIANILRKCVTVSVPRPGVWTDTTPKYGIFVCPGNDKSGELETAAWDAWASKSENRARTICIAKYIECMKNAGVVGKSPDKVRVGTMLAVYSDDDPRLGPGAQKRIFDFESEALVPMKTFLAPLVTTKSMEKTS